MINQHKAKQAGGGVFGGSVSDAKTPPCARMAPPLI